MEPTKCHEECSDVAALVSLAVGLVGKPGGQGNLKCPEERDGKDEEQQGEYQVGNPVGADGIGSRRALEESYYQTQNGVDGYN